MANIADNLKRLLGTEGNNIQEVLENADSIGGGASDIPYIQFVQTGESTGPDDLAFEVGEIRGITDATKYTGPCYMNIIAPAMMFPAPGVTMLGSAYSYPLTEEEIEYVSTYSSTIVTYFNSEITYHIFEVSSDTVTYDIRVVSFSQ